jgi:hypothetical protein
MKFSIKLLTLTILASTVLSDFKIFLVGDDGRDDKLTGTTEGGIQLTSASKPPPETPRGLSMLSPRVRNLSIPLLNIGKKDTSPNILQFPNCEVKNIVSISIYLVELNIFKLYLQCSTSSITDRQIRDFNLDTYKAIKNYVREINNDKLKAARGGEGENKEDLGVTQIGVKLSTVGFKFSTRIGDMEVTNNGIFVQPTQVEFGRALVPLEGFEAHFEKIDNYWRDSKRKVICSSPISFDVGDGSNVAPNFEINEFTRLKVFLNFCGFHENLFTGKCGKSNKKLK